MSEKAERVVDRTREMIREITDPREFRRQLEEMLTDEFPAPKAIFEPGERLPLHRFMERFQGTFCKRNVPTFYQWPVTVEYDQGGDLVVILEGTRTHAEASA